MTKYHIALLNQKYRNRGFVFFARPHNWLDKLDINVQSARNMAKKSKVDVDFPSSGILSARVESVVLEATSHHILPENLIHSVQNPEVVK